MRFIGVILFFLMLSSTAHAISPVTPEVIREAQKYGQDHAKIQERDFLRPWISYEEKAERLNEAAEHARIYTPFLLIASDTRAKSLKGQIVNLADSEKILKDYAGTLTFSVVLFGAEAHFGQNTKVTLEQNNQIIKAYEVIIPKEAKKTVGQSNKLNYLLQCYFYFKEKEIERHKPMVLSIITGDKKTHRFYFSSKNVK